MNQPLDVLKTYWKHEAFRPTQEEIITTVLSGKDTFALLPTGGGKSICFQIPALLLPGICLVISPLVALMKDQVENLKAKNIKAITLAGGISFEETNNLLDNCAFGGYKFLYVSPERLQQDWVLERIKSLNVNLVAIDEAHCISQWGHDFRPAYLKIAALKDYFKVPFIALTATATPRVETDICTLLQLENPVIFKNSFARENLGYHIIKTEDKLGKLKQIFIKNPEPSIIYVKNRKSCIEYSQTLNDLGFTSTFYHGGLSTKEKENNMKLWLEEKTKIIVATNAFGMGIDKPNVKTVVHLQIPDNIENYYQEAGRAGRNGNKSFALLLTPEINTEQLKNYFISNLPNKEFLHLVYKNLNNHFQIAYGEGFEELFYLNLNQFCAKYNISVTKTFACLQFLDRQGILTLNNLISNKASLQFLIESREVIRYTSLNSKDAPVIETILRNYTGVFEQVTIINTALIATKSGTSEEKVITILNKLQAQEMIDLKLQSNDISILYNEPREDSYTINRVVKILENQNQIKVEQYNAMLDFVSDTSKCKSVLISKYFGEENAKPCGICSYCSLKNKSEPKSVSTSIQNLLKNTALSSKEIENTLTFSTEEIIFALQNLLENDSIFLNSNNKYQIK
ncbi:RecQ family ATP-dependent DNA helicase [Flavobacterium difficile]|uniref:ATP-dependent DNA helicase RecQ n=1 Tax=Flavobacterium difficile TaxID=2709659 RepID=A0ABX0I7L4_9FLAO|nr:ATP-dependent DNA helicase RecQ [Flavobacterium difficile]NHM02135.1 RecQ family ATP-dependent DNA helicase [Flavobacterium difficile]